MSIERPSSTPHRIDEEVVCVDALRHVICRLSGSTVVDIHPEPNDPPDFTVTVNGRRFPVEVTSIVSDQQYHAHCLELGRHIRDHATSLGALSGTYAIRISRKPGIPRPKSLEGRDLCDAALAYITSTREQAEGPETLLNANREGKIFIVKLSGNGAAVGVVRSGAVWLQHQIRDQLVPLLQVAVDKKRQRLSDVGIRAQNALLLLYDAFGYAEPDDVLAALDQVSGYDWFHSVFWAVSFTDRPNATAPGEPGREGLFLYSNDAAWHRVGTVSILNANPGVTGAVYRGSEIRSVPSGPGR